MVALALFATHSVAYAKKNAEPEVKLTAEGENFLQTYTKLLEKLRTELAQELPQVEQKQRAAFMEACKVESAAFDEKMKGQTAANNSRAKNKDELQKQLTDAEKKLAAAEAKTRTLAKDLLVNLDKTLTNDALDAQLVKCTVITKATPRGIAEFCQQGKESAALIEKLLADTALMKQMLIAEGASNGKFPEAMKIYSDILKASPRAAKGIYAADPFQSLDQTGVGKLVEMGTKLGRSTRKKLKVGICGEHGGEPSSIDFCHRVGMNYVSCSPFRVPIARLAAAQAAVR